MVLFFTGTGNSRYAASVIASICEDEAVSINHISRERIHSPFTAQYSFQSEKPFVVVCPTYCGRIPRLVEDFLKDSRFVGSRDIYFYLSCGGATGNAGKYTAELAAKLELNYKGMASSVMPDNYLIMYKPSEYDEAQGMLRAALPQIESSARLIKAGRELYDVNSGHAFMSAVTPYMYKYYISDKKFRVTDKCTGCGLCAELCPLVNISIEDSKPKWNGNCTHCVACISACPENAIEYGKATEKRRRYYLYEDGKQKAD